MCVCVCMCGFCNVWVCVCVRFVMCGCVYVCVLAIVWVFGNMCTCIHCVFLLFSLCIFILVGPVAQSV